MTITIEHIENEIVRLRWDGFYGWMYVDFDACPHRGLTAEESAREWAARVLGMALVSA